MDKKVYKRIKMIPILVITAILLVFAILNIWGAYTYRTLAYGENVSTLNGISYFLGSMHLWVNTFFDNLISTSVKSNFDITLANINNSAMAYSTMVLFIIYFVLFITLLVLLVIAFIKSVMYDNIPLAMGSLLLNILLGILLGTQTLAYEIRSNINYDFWWPLLTITPWLIGVGLVLVFLTLYVGAKYENHVGVVTEEEKVEDVQAKQEDQLIIVTPQVKESCATGQCPSKKDEVVEEEHKECCNSQPVLTYDTECPKNGECSKEQTCPKEGECTKKENCCADTKKCCDIKDCCANEEECCDYPNLEVCVDDNCKHVN